VLEGRRSKACKCRAAQENIVLSDREAPVVFLPVKGVPDMLRTVLEQAAGSFEQAVLRALPAAVYTTDATGRITFYNDAAAEMWGLRPELGTAKFCGSWKLYWPDGRAMAHDECPMALALKTQKPNRGNEAIAERPDGTRVPFVAYPTPLFDTLGNLIGAVNMLVDLGDRRLNEQRLISIVESSDDAIVSKDLNGIIATWNKGAERIFGYAASEIVGKSILTLIPPSHHSEEHQILSRIRNGERIEHYETVRRRKDGSTIDVSLTVSPLRDAQGIIVGASKIARDITERKMLQAQQALLVGEMKHRVKNTLATVQAIATQSMRHIPRTDWSGFLGRLQALASAHDLLTNENWNRASLHDIVQQVITPFDSRRFDIEGPRIWLSASHSLTLVMALHELATNAAKYGALSTDSGRVRLSWRVAGSEPGSVVDMEWQESGGPAATPPEHKGFGSMLLERTLDKSTTTYGPDGFKCAWQLTL
jgi:PAS domain S-box-containing protein